MILGGQHTPFSGGQHAPFWGGQLKPILGGQYERFFQITIPTLYIITLKMLS